MGLSTSSECLLFDNVRRYAVSFPLLSYAKLYVSSILSSSSLGVSLIIFPHFYVLTWLTRSYDMMSLSLISSCWVLALRNWFFDQIWISMDFSQKSFIPYFIINWVFLSLYQELCPELFQGRLSLQNYYIIIENHHLVMSAWKPYSWAPLRALAPQACLLSQLHYSCLPDHGSPYISQ